MRRINLTYRMVKINCRLVSVAVCLLSGLVMSYAHATGTGTVNYPDVTILNADVGTIGAPYAAVNFNTSSNNVNQTIGYNIFSDQVTLGGSAGTTAVSKQLYGGGRYKFVAGTTVDVSADIYLGGAITMANATTALNLGTAHVNIGGGITTNGGALSFTVNTNDLLELSGTSPATSITTGSGYITNASGGSLTMAGTEKIHINYVGSLLHGDVFNLISTTAGSTISGYEQNENGDLISDNSFVIDTTVLTDNSGNLLLTAARTGGVFSVTTYDAAQNYVYKSNTLGDISNNAAIALGKIAAEGTQADDMAIVIRSLDIDQYGFGNNAQNLATQMKRLAPIANASLVQTSFMVSDKASHAIDDRLASLRGDVYAANAVTDGAWATLIGAVGRQEKSARYDGFKNNMVGLLFGMDHRINKNIVFGTTASYANSHVAQQDLRLGDGLGIQSYQIVGYAGLTKDDAYIDGNIMYAKHQYGGRRTTAVNRVADTNFNGNQFSVRLGTGYHIPLKNNIIFTPMALLDRSNLTQHAYAETGAQALNLNVDTLSVNRTRLGIGARVNSDVQWRGIELHPILTIMYMRDVGQVTTDIVSQYQGGGDKFITPGAALSKNAINIGAGMTINAGKTSSIKVAYDLEKRAGFIGHSAELIARWVF